MQPNYEVLLQENGRMRLGMGRALSPEPRTFSGEHADPFSLLVQENAT